MKPSLADRICLEIKGDDKAWTQDPRRRYEKIQKLLTLGCLQAFKKELVMLAACGVPARDTEDQDSLVAPGCPTVAAARRFEVRGSLPRGVTMEQLRALFWAVKQDRRLPRSVRDQAAEVDHAFTLLSPVRPSQARQPLSQPGVGRICRWCWRTEAEHWIDRAGGLGLCHLHDEMRLPPAIVARPMTLDQEAKAWAIHGAEVRRRVSSARRLLKAAPATLLTPYGYPLYERTVNRLPDAASTWCEWVQREYPLSTDYLINAGGLSALAGPIETHKALEDRPLTGLELEELKKPWQQDVPLARCEAWQRLVHGDRHPRSGRRKAGPSGTILVHT